MSSGPWIFAVGSGLFGRCLQNAASENGKLSLISNLTWAHAPGHKKFESVSHVNVSPLQMHGEKLIRDRFLLHFDDAKKARVHLLRSADKVPCSSLGSHRTACRSRSRRALMEEMTEEPGAPRGTVRKEAPKSRDCVFVNMKNRLLNAPGVCGRNVHRDECVRRIRCPGRLKLRLSSQDHCCSLSSPRWFSRCSRGRQSHIWMKAQLA